MKRRVLLGAFFLALASSSASASTPAVGFAESEVVAGFDRPTAMAFLPDGRFLVTELGGRLLLYDGGSPKTLIDISVCTAPESEMGLLGVAVHPAFPRDRRIYLYRTRKSVAGCDAPAPDRENELICVELAGDSVDPGTLLVLLSGIRADTGVHNGGGLRVGPDAKIYIGVGDAGVGDDAAPGASTNPYAQDPNALEGKILRVEFDGSVPPDNPFVGQTGKRGEVFALGFRNPFRFGFDPATRRLWAGDVGEHALEEIDVVVEGAN
ncbi:MAG TPA: PQQ-dependent sugar dehydrogenase, partial [Candidatus Binatia bacterium]|nr:PQQ-dependent sugar dehydrogenase [Candidatus Binatia bacterium]